MHGATIKIVLGIIFDTFIPTGIKVIAPSCVIFYPRVTYTRTIWRRATKVFTKTYWYIYIYIYIYNVLILCVTKNSTVREVMPFHSDTVRSRFNNKQDRQCIYDVTLRRETIVAMKKKCFTYSECVFVALVIHEQRMRHIVICGPSGSKYFSTLYCKRLDFRKRVIEYKTWVLSLKLNISHSKKNWARYNQKCMLGFT